MKLRGWGNLPPHFFLWREIVLKLHEAWFEAAEQIASGREGWICNAVKRLYRMDKISHATLSQIHKRIQIERRRQGVRSFDPKVYDTTPSGPSSALWQNLNIGDDDARKVVRLRFIAKELRRLAKV